MCCNPGYCYFILLCARAPRIIYFFYFVQRVSGFFVQWHPFLTFCAKTPMGKLFVVPWHASLLFRRTCTKSIPAQWRVTLLLSLRIFAILFLRSGAYLYYFPSVHVRLLFLLLCSGTYWSHGKIFDKEQYHCAGISLLTNNRVEMVIKLLYCSERSMERDRTTMGKVEVVK